MASEFIFLCSAITENVYCNYCGVCIYTYVLFPALIGGVIWTKLCMHIVTYSDYWDRFSKKVYYKSKFFGWKSDVTFSVCICFMCHVQLNGHQNLYLVRNFVQVTTKCGFRDSGEDTAIYSKIEINESGHCWGKQDIGANNQDRRWSKTKHKITEAGNCWNRRGSEIT